MRNANNSGYTAASPFEIFGSSSGLAPIPADDNANTLALAEKIQTSLDS